MSAQLGDEASSGNNAEEIEREHQLQLQQQSKAKRRKVAGVVCGVPLGLFVLGLLTGVIEIVADVQVETCAEISDRLLCQASKAECCYNGITNNCTDLADCDPVCGPGFESYDNLGVEPCVACEPGWADTDEDPTTPCDICDPGTFAGSQSIECALCDGGTADTDEDAATLCEACSSGTEARGTGENTGATRCDLCDAGRYDHDSDSAAGILSASTPCVQCEAGRFAGTEGQHGECQQCEPGWYASTGESECTVCPAGQHDSDSNSATECQYCANGKAQSEAGATSCVQCNAGQVSHSAHTSCVPCEVGQFANIETNSCEDCSPGQADIDTDAGTACEECISGTYSSAPATSGPCSTCGIGSHYISSSQCEDCPAGQFSADPDSACAICPSGKVSTLPQQASCADCSATEVPNNQHTECLQCDPGSFIDQISFQCVPCSAGQADSDSSSATECTDCNPGKFSAAAAALTCIGPCPTGTFTPGNEPCSACDAGKVDDDSDSATPCQPCPAGTYAHGSLQCLPCPAGKFSLGQQDDCTACAAGQFRPSASQVCEMCPTGQSSVHESNACGCSAGSEGTGLGTGCPLEVNGIGQGALVCHCYGPGAGRCAAALIIHSNYTSNNAIRFGDNNCAGCGSCAVMCASFDPPTKTCTICPPGKTDDDSDPATPCLSCEPGQYSPQGSEGIDGCVDCSPGQADTDTDPATPCVLCQVGEEAIPGVGQQRQTLCASCSDPRFDDDENPTTPCICPAGMMGGDMDANGNPSRCIDCSERNMVGNISGGVHVCTSCEAGHVAKSASGGLSRPTICEECPSGQYDHDGLASTACVMCRAGQHAGAGQTECISCARNYFDHDARDYYPSLEITATTVPPQSESAMTPCQLCGIDPILGVPTYSSPVVSCAQSPCQEYGQVACISACPEGTWGVPGGVCEPCPAGTSTDMSRASAAGSTAADCEQCDAGRYNSAGTPCTDCEWGRYDDDSSASTPCTLCAAGQYSRFDLQGATAVVGHQLVPTRPLSCVQCPADSFDDDDDPTTPCVACPAGKTSFGGTASSGCSDCPAGRGSWPAPGLGNSYHVYSQGCFSAAAGAIESRAYIDRFQMPLSSRSANFCAELCANYTSTDPWIRANNLIAVKGGTCYCLTTLGRDSLHTEPAGDCNTAVCEGDLGSWCGSTNADRYSVYEYIASTPGCVDCEAGQFSSSGNPCSNCPAGFYSEQALSPSCLPCVAGSWTNQSTPSTTCEICEPGKSDSDNDPSTECATCSPGRYNDSPGSISCSSCAPGFGSNTSNGADWTPCSVDTCRLRTSCLPCTPGQHSAGGEECADCVEGQNDHDSTPATPCQSCGLGKYAENAAVQCVSCATGRADKDSDPSTACEYCSEGQHAPTLGLRECVHCAPGKQSDSTLGAAGCEDCNPGKYSTSTSIALSQSCQECAAGQAQPGPGSTSCVDCQPGQYSVDGGNAECTDCARGEYQDRHAETSCKDCPLGRTASETGLRICSECAAGRFTPTQRATECMSCSSGKIAPTAGHNSTDCQSCQTGQIQNGSDFIRCVNCPSGYTSNGPNLIGGTECHPCEAGKYHNTSTLMCQICGAGQYQPTTAQESCLQCPPGRKGTAAESQRRACPQCQAGQISDTEGSVSCAQCPPGRIQNGSNYTVCMPCAAGYQSNPSETECVACQPGRNASYGTQCDDCATGQYQAAEAAATCGICAAGKYSAMRAETCTDCPSGKYQKDSKSGECIDCSPGSYQMRAGQTQCIACVEGKANPLPRQTSNQSCNTCAPGQYQDRQGADRCTLCVQGTASSAEGLTVPCLKCQPGRYQNKQGNVDCRDCPRGTDVAEPGVMSAAACMPCTPEAACEGGGECARGYTSGIDDGAAFCSFCERGYFKMRDKCHKCPAASAWISVLAGAIFIVFAFMMIGLAGGSENQGLGKRTSTSAMKMRMVVPFSIAVVRFQLNLEFFNIDVQWPPGLLDWLKWFDFALNLDFGVVLSPECVTDFEDPASAFVMRHVAMGAVFPAMCLCICVVYVLKMLWSGRSRGTNVVNPMVATWQITFINCAKLVFRSFDCTHTSTGYKLDAAPSIACNPWTDSRYLPILLTGLWVGLVYCLLIPTLLFRYLNRADKSDVERVQSRFGWVFLRYHPRRWYYELVLLGQKATTAAISVFLGSNSRLLKSLFSNLFVTITALRMHHHFQPFPAFHDDPKVLGVQVSDNLLEVFGILLQVVTLLGGLIFYYRNDNDCNVEGTCNNVCRYCFLGDTGSEKPLYRDPTNIVGFAKSTVLAPGQAKEDVFWRLSPEPQSDPSINDHCEDPSDPVGNRHECEVFCKDDDPISGRNRGSFGKNTFGGVCYYSGFRDAADTKEDAANSQYVESSLETAVTLVIILLYAAFVYLIVTKSAKTWRKHMTRLLGIGQVEKHADEDDSIKYLSLEDAAARRRERAAMVAIFERLDTDHSHTLSIAELSKAMDLISEFTYAPVRSDEVTEALKSLDEDNSGEVDMTEFLAWITNPDDELAQATKHILADVGSANVAVSFAEVSDSTEYALPEALRLQFIKEIIAAKEVIGTAHKDQTQSFPVDDADNGLSKNIRAGDEREDETRVARLAYVQHRLFADADAKETNLVYSMNDALESEKLTEGPQFGLQAVRKFAHFYARAVKLHQKNCAEGANLVVIPFGVRGGDTMYIDEQGMPMPLTRVFEMTEATPMQHEVDPQSSRVGTLKVGTLVEVLEEKSFIVNSTDDSISSGIGHHLTLRRLRVVCKTVAHGVGVVRIGSIEVGWITHKETLVRTDKPPVLARMYTVPLMMTPGQCIEEQVETEPGWYRVVRKTPRAADAPGLERSRGRSYLYPGELVRVADNELVHDSDGKLARIALKFNWRMRHSTGAAFGDWEDMFNAASHAFLGFIIAAVGFSASAVLLKEVQQCGTGASVPANDFCLSSRFFDSKSMAQCLAHSDCCEWNMGARICESNQGDNECEIRGGAARLGVCQHVQELVVAVVVIIAVGLAVVANVQRLHSHNLMTMQDTPSSIRMSVGAFQVGAVLAAGASLAVSFFAEDFALIGTSIAVAASALVGIMKRRHTRSLTRAALLLVFTMGIQAALLGMHSTKDYVWEHEGCVNSSGFAFLPEPAGISTPASCAQRCYDKSSSTLDHRYRDRASTLTSQLDNMKLGRRLQTEQQQQQHQQQIQPQPPSGRRVLQTSQAEESDAGPWDGPEVDQPGCIWSDSAVLNDSPCSDHWYVDAGSYSGCEALCLSEPTCSFIQSENGFDESCDLVRNCDPSHVRAAGGTGLLRSRECLRAGSCSDPMAVTFNPQATANQGGCVYDCVALHLAFRDGTSNGACEIIDDDVRCTDQVCSASVSSHASLIIQGIPPIGSLPAAAPASSSMRTMKRYSRALTALQGALLVIRHVLYTPEPHAQAGPLYCQGCKLLFLEYCAFANHTSGAVKMVGPLEPATDPMLTGLIMKHVLIESNYDATSGSQVVEVHQTSATFLFCDFAVDQGILAVGGATTTRSSMALKIVGTRFTGSSGGQNPTVIFNNWQYDWSVIGVEPNTATFFERRGTVALGQPTTCDSAAACGGSSDACEDVNLPSIGDPDLGPMTGIRCTSCPAGKSGADCMCSVAAMVVGSHCETSVPVASALRGAGLVQWNDASSALTTRFATGSVLGQQRCWCGVDAPEQTVAEQICVDERLGSGPRTVQFTLNALGSGSSRFYSVEWRDYEISTVAGTYTAQGTLNGRLLYVQTADLEGNRVLGTSGTHSHSPFQLAWNGAEWVLFDSFISDEYHQYAQKGWAASRGLGRLAASTGGVEIQKTRWADFSVQVVSDGASESTAFEVYTLRGSVVAEDMRTRCFAYSTMCGTTVVFGGLCALLAAVGLVLSPFAAGSGTRPTVKHSTGWAEAWVRSGPRHGLMLLERIIDRAVIKQLDAAAKVRATTVVTLGLPDNLIMLHATTGFVASQALLWLKSKWPQRRKIIQKHTQRSTTFKAHLYRDTAVLTVFGVLVGNIASDRECFFDSYGHTQCYSNKGELMVLGGMIGAVVACVETAWRSSMRRSSKVGWIFGLAAFCGALAARCIYTAPPLCAEHSDCAYVEGKPAFCHANGVCRQCAPRCECEELTYASNNCSTGYCFQESVTSEIPQSACTRISITDENHGDWRCREHDQCYVDYYTYPPTCRAYNLDNECSRIDPWSCSHIEGCDMHWDTFGTPRCISRSASMELQASVCNSAGLGSSCTCMDILNVPGVGCDSVVRDVSTIVADTISSNASMSTWSSMIIKRAGYGINCPDIGRSWDDTSRLANACNGHSLCSYVIDPSAIDPESSYNSDGFVADWVDGVRGVCVKTYAVVYDCGCGEQFVSSHGAGIIDFDCATCRGTSGEVETIIEEICPLACHALGGGKVCFGNQSDHNESAPESRCEGTTEGCSECSDGIDGTCGMCAPGGRSERDETCRGDKNDRFERMLSLATMHTSLRAFCIPVSMIVGAAAGLLMIGFMTDLGSDVAAARAEADVHISCCAHCWHGTSGFARKLGISSMISISLYTINLGAQTKLGLGPVLFRFTSVERVVADANLESDNSYYLYMWILGVWLPLSVMTALCYLLLRLWSHSGTLLADMGFRDAYADADADADENSPSEDGQNLVQGNAVVIDGEARKCVEAVALAPHDMLQGRMLVPVIEYIVRTRTTVRAYPGSTAPAVGSVGKREILVALEERFDHSGKLWAQFRNDAVTVDSKLGWVQVESPWDKSQADSQSNLPVKLGVPKHAEIGEAPVRGGTLGVEFTESPHPVFVMTRYDSAQNDDMHWRHAFENAEINGNDVFCPTRMFAAVKVDGRLAAKSKNGSWYFEVHVNFSGVAQIGWATQEFESPSNRAPFVGNDLFSWGFDGHNWVVWHNGEAKAIKPFEPTTLVRVVSAKKNKKQPGAKITILVFGKPSITSEHGKLAVAVGSTFQVHREIHNKAGTWVFVNCPDAWRKDDSDVSGRHEGWLRLPRSGKLSTRQVKKALAGDKGDITSHIDLKHWATDVTLERVSDAEAANSGNSVRWKAGDVVACKLQIHEHKASISWEWNGRSLPYTATTVLQAGQRLMPVMSCIGGPLGRPAATFALSPREMRHDLPEGYNTIMCRVTRPSKTKEVVVVNRKSKRGARVPVSIPEGANPGSQVEIKLPSGHVALGFVPDNIKDRVFHVSFPSAPDTETAACERGAYEFTVPKGWQVGPAQTYNGVDEAGRPVEVEIPAGAAEGDRVKCALPLDPKITAVICPRSEPMLKLKPQHLKHPVGTKFHVLSEMTTTEGEWLQIASGPRSVNDVAGADVRDLSSGGLERLRIPIGEVLGWVLIHCDKHEHEEKNLRRVVESERQLVVNQLRGDGMLCIRQSASTSSKILGKVSGGTTLEMVDSVAHNEGVVVQGARSGVWVRVRVNEQIGWVQAMAPHPDESASPGLFRRTRKAGADDDLSGVHIWHCLPQSTEIIESLERAAPPQYIEVDIPTVRAGSEPIPAEPGSLVEVAVPLTGHTMHVVIPAKSVWRKKIDGRFSFVTRLITPETGSAATHDQYDGTDEASIADVVAPDELQRTLQAVDSEENCVITASENGVGTKAAAVGGPVTVRGCVRGGRGRWYFEVRVANGEGSVGICSAQFQNRKKTRAPHGFEKLGQTVSLQTKQDSVQTKGPASRAKKGRHREEDELKTAQMHNNASGHATKWTAKEMAYALPTYDKQMRPRAKGTGWQTGEIFRTIIDHEVHEVAIPPKYAGGMVAFEVTNRYCALGEDPNSLNCAYKYVPRQQDLSFSHGMSSGFSTRLPNVKWHQQSDLDRRTGKVPEGKEGKTVPAGVARAAGNEAEGLLWKLCRWKANDIVGVCVDTAQLAVHYTLNGVPVGSVSYDGYDSYDSFYPAASIGAGDEMTFFFRECDMSHTPPVAGCNYFKVGQEAIDEETEHESEPWDTCTVTLPMDADPDSLDGVLQRVPVKTNDGRIIMAVVPAGSKPGETIKVKVPVAQLIGHFQVLMPAIVRQGVAVTSPKVSGAAGRLTPGSVISIFEIRTIKSRSDTVEGQLVDVRRARTTVGWFSLVIDGQDVVVEAEMEDQTAAVQGIAESLQHVERSHSEQRRQAARKEVADKHLGEQGMGRAQTVPAVSVAFTASAIEFHSKRRGSSDPRASLAEIHRTAQISTSVARANDQPGATRLTPVVRETTTPKRSTTDSGTVTYANPMRDASGLEAEIFDNPLVSAGTDIDLDEPVPELAVEEGVGSIDAHDLSHANATIHLDSSHHSGEFDDFIDEIVAKRRA